jgi:transposase-like protein
MEVKLDLHDRPFLSPKEVVTLLLKQGIEVTDDTVRNWCRLGLQNEKRPEARYKLGSVRIGGRIYVLRSELEVFVPLLADRIGTPG